MSIEKQLKFRMNLIGADKLERHLADLQKRADKLHQSLMARKDQRLSGSASAKFGEDMVESVRQRQTIGRRSAKANIHALNRITNVHDGFGLLDRTYSDGKKAAAQRLVLEKKAAEMAAKFHQINADKRKRMLKGEADFRAKIAKEEIAAAKQRAALEKKAAEMAAKFHKMNADKRNRLVKGEADFRANIAKAEIANTKMIEKASKEHIAEIKDNMSDAFKTGFSFHILQMYAIPLIRAARMIMEQTITIFADFDRKFADYVAKSQEYASHISKSDFYKLTAGQVYSVTDAADAAERFAASGVDVAKSQEALQRALEVSKISGLSYKDSANGIIRTMQALHLNITDVTMITDAMVNAANASTAELKDLVGWFEYAASAAYNAGLNVQQLSAMLGILSTTGMPNAGTAIRQMFMQFSKDDVRNKFMERFSWIDEDMFHDIDTLVSKLREYVQASDDQTRAAREITTLIGGKVTAQQSLNNLLIAEPEIWDQVRTAVMKTGTTVDLYAKVTNNAADAIQRMRNSVQLIYTQVGEFLVPILNVADKSLQVVVNVMNGIPSAFKQAAGAVGFMTAGLVMLGSAVVGVMGATSVMQGILHLLELQKIRNAQATDKNTAANLGFAKTLRLVIRELAAANGITGTYTTTLNRLGMSYRGLVSAMSGLTFGLMGIYAAQSAVEKHMIAEARLVGHLTSLWLTYHTVKAVGLTGWGGVAGGIAAFSASDIMIQGKISEWERNARLERFRAQSGTSGQSITFNNAQLNIMNDEGDSFINELTYASGGAI